MIVHAYYPHSETRVQREAEALRSAGYRVDVVCLRLPSEPAAEEVDGVEVHRVPVQRTDRRPGTRGFGAQLVEYVRFALGATVVVARLHLRRRYRVVQIHNPPDFLIIAAIIPKVLGARVIVDLHDLMPEFMASRLGRDMTHPLVRLLVWQERVACRIADHVITVTEPWRRTLRERGSARRSHSSVVLNLADTSYFQPSDPPPDDEFRVIYHGTLARRYGVELILAAAARLKDRIPNLRVTIHGRGELGEALPQLATDLGVSDLLHLSTEFVPVADLPHVIRWGHVGVVPYRRDVFTDGILPTKLMEYAALGMPAIVARSSAIEAYFDDSMVDFFEPGDVDGLADRIEALYRDPGRRKTLSENIGRFRAQHDWPSEAARYLALVDRLARRSD
jgi:glycosyltransferase involved in cell wall biosynthesis